MLSASLLTLALSLQNVLSSPSPDASPSLTVSIPTSPPSNAVSPSANLVALSIEGDRWPDWAAVAPSYTQRNDFAFNVLTNLQQKVGSATSFRIGADSEDRILFNSKVAVESATYGPPTSSMPYPEASSATVSNAYYALSRFLPSGTKVTWGINFGANNVTLAVQEANAILSVFGSGRNDNGVLLDQLELGNEADLFGGNGHRTGTWNIQTYVTQWTQFMQQIIQSTGLKQGQKPGIQALAFGGSDHGNGGFSPQQAFKDGLLTSSIGKFITVISQHKYSGGCCTAKIEDLMSKNFIRNNLTAFNSDIASVKAQGLPYVFGEGNSYFNHGVPKVSDAGGSAIWITDYILFGATIGIQQMYFHEGIGYKYNLIQPVSLSISTEDGTPLNPPQAAHVAPSYYGAIVVNEFLGTSSGRELVEINTSSSSSISGYAIYTGGTLRRALFINHDAFHSGTRSSVNVNLGGSGSVQVKRLSVPTSDVFNGLKWGGQTYDTSNGLVSGSLSTSTQQRSSPLVVSATEVVMVTF